MSRKSETSDFWKRLMSAAAFAGATQAEIARLVGLGQSVVRRWRLGEVLPTVDAAIVLAKRAGVPVDWLLTGRALATVAVEGDADLDELVRLFGGLRLEGRSFVLQAARYAARAAQ